MGGYGDGYPPPGEYPHRPPPPHGEHPPPPRPPVYGSSPYGAPYPPIPAGERAFEAYPPPHGAFPAVPFEEPHPHHHHPPPHGTFPFEEHHPHYPPPAVPAHHPPPRPAVPAEELYGHHHAHPRPAVLAEEYPPAYPAVPVEEHHGHHHHHHHHEENYGTVRDRSGLPSGQLVRLHCQANTDFNLAARYDGVVLLPANAHDESQQWIKDMSWGTRVKDEKGFPAFTLINKATGKALKHPGEELQQVLLTDYNPTGLDESVLWTESEDMGNGYRTLRMANNIKLNLDAFRGDKKSGGVREGTPAVLFRWKKQENQLWKIVPENLF